MASTLASSQNSQQPQPQPQAHQQPPASNSSTTEGQETSPTPTKRGPGRPKGSTKKTLETDPSTAKIKRPVGRPRKDGRPAGSVPKVSRGPGRPRKNIPPDYAVNTFPQQQQAQQGQGDQQDWPPMHGMFNNYRLPKDASDTPVADSANADRTSASSGTADNSNMSQTPKWYPAATAANPTAASSSSIANALIHPPSMSQSAGPSHLVDSLMNVHSALGLASNRDQHVNNANNIRSASRAFADVSPSILIAQIPDFILSTIYSLFSRQPVSGLPLPRDVLSTYRGHLGHLTGSHAVAYNYLKTFWLPYSPVLFRLVLPRSGTSKSSHRNSSASNKPPSSSNNNIPSIHSNPPNINGQNQNTNRTPVSGDQTFDTHRFFYWDPFHLSLSGPLTCPVCQQAPLTHIGPIRTGPLRVFDLPSSSSPSASAHAHSAGLVPTAFYVIGMQYGCVQSTCGVKLNSWDPRIVNNLPQVLADEWPVHLGSVSQETEMNDSKGVGLSGNAVSRPLYTLVRSLVQAGTPQEGIRDILARLWNWSDSERDDDHEEDEEEEDAVAIEDNGINDKEKAAEAIFASPYQRLWSAHTVHNHEAEASSSVSAVNGQRPTKRQKRDEVPPSNAPMISASAPVPTYSSRLFGADSGTSGLALQMQHPPEHRTNGSGPEHRSPRSQPQPPPLAPPQTRPQVSQSQLQPNPPPRPQQQPGSRTSITHAHAPHIHTPSPIYPSTSLPSSNTNSPQTGQGAALSLKRPLEPEPHHQASGGGPPVPPASVSAQTSPAQTQFPGLVHNSPYPHLRTLQQQHAHAGRPPQQPHPPQQSHPPPPQHPHPSQQSRPPQQSHPQQQPHPQQPPHPTHHHPPRHEPLLHMHPSLVHPSNALPRYNSQATIHSHQSLLSTAPQPAQPQPTQQQPPQQQPPPHPPTAQRRVRHCVKCGRHDCKGKGGSQFCKNPCKDCGGMDCRGRNSKRPNATCREGW